MVWYEIAVITSTGMVFLAFLVYLLLARVPSPEDLVQIGTAIIDAKIKEFGLASPPAGGRTGEGLIDRVLAIPGVQDIITGMLQNMGPGGSGGGSHSPGYVRR